jgi:hypothetical protein
MRFARIEVALPRTRPRKGDAHNWLNMARCGTMVPFRRERQGCEGRTSRRRLSSQRPRFVAPPAYGYLAHIA